MKRILAISLATWTFSALMPGTLASAADNTCWNARPIEQDFTRRLNSARETHRIGNLRLDPELSKAARVHTREMVRRNELYHTPEARLTARITGWMILGENVGVGGSVGSLNEAFMGSPAHRDNVLHTSFKHVGVGAMKRDGRMWVTIIFEGSSDPATPLRMPSC